MMRDTGQPKSREHWGLHDELIICAKLLVAGEGAVSVDPMQVHHVAMFLIVI